MDELHLSYSQVGVLGTINSIFWMLFYIVWGRRWTGAAACGRSEINFILTIFMSLAFFGARDMWLAAVGYIFIGHHRRRR